MTDDEALAEYVELLPELREFASTLVATLGIVLDRYSPDIKYRIKAWESVLEKAKRRSVLRVADLPDLVGIRVILPVADGLYDAYEVVAKQYFIEARETVHLRPGESSTHLLVRSNVSPASGIRAEIQIMTPEEEARRALERETFFKTAAPRTKPAAIQANPTLSLRNALTEFIELLDIPHLHEKNDVHPFLMQHQFILFPNPDAITSEVPIGLGTEYKIDFLVRDPCGTYLLVEIENPQASLVTKGGDLSATVNHALCQVEDWQEWIESNLPIVEKYYPGIKSPEAWVIVGRDRDLSDAGKRRIARRNINMRGRVKIRTYDDLLRDANAYVQSIENAFGRSEQ